jgi:hypothetical protein
MNRTSLAVFTVAISVFGASTAYAQDTSTVGGAAGGTVSTEGQATATVPKPVVAAPAPAPAAPAAEGPSDHEQVVGRFAVGYFGISQIPIANQGGGAGALSAPVIGMRYWMSDRIGLDVGLGFRTQSGTTETVAGNVTQTVDQPGALALGVKAGVPIALAYGKHFTFTLVPELFVGGATRTVQQPNQPDISLTGSRIELGARIGGEIQFGFIGIPQLALQGSVGVNVARIAAKGSQDLQNGTQSQAFDQIVFGTTVQNDPWALFTNSISALYYF